MSVTVRAAAGPQEIEAALTLRTDVFVGEQGVSEAEELDGHDDRALHLVALGADGAVLGTCRLLADGPKVKLGRMAVAPGARRRGIALALLEAADEHARALGGERIVLASQVYAVPLYERAGYRAYGEVFLDAGLEHLWMDKLLA